MLLCQHRALHVESYQAWNNGRGDDSRKAAMPFPGPRLAWAAPADNVLQTQLCTRAEEDGARAP